MQNMNEPTRVPLQSQYMALKVVYLFKCIWCTRVIIVIVVVVVCVTTAHTTAQNLTISTNFICIFHRPAL